MDFPGGHQSHSHRYPPPPPPPPFGRPAVNDNFPRPPHRPPPPQSYYGGANAQLPSLPYPSTVNAPPPVYTSHHHHHHHLANNTPPPHTASSSSVHHVSHGSPPQAETIPPASHHHHHHHRPHLPSFHHEANRPEFSPEFYSKPTVRVFTKAKTDYSLTIREGKVILAPSNPSDPHQQWIKDEKYGKVKDEAGFPSFSLINKATGEALKHSISATQPVQLTPYNQDVVDESVLWSLSKDLGDGYRTIRMATNIRLNIDAYNGNQEHGGVHDGTPIVLWEWKKGENQRWNIVPN